MKVRFSRIRDAAGTVLAVLLLLLALLLGGARLFGLTPYVVLSGSMEPTYPTGGLLYVKQAAPAEVSVGDPITFRMGSGGGTATHRVVEIDQAARCFRTRGDANNTADASPVPFADLIGKPVFCIPLLGYPVSWIMQGKYAVWILPAALAVLLLAPRLFGRDEESGDS